MKRVIKILVESVLAGLGSLWLFFEAYYTLNEVSYQDRISFWKFVIIGLVLGIIWFFIDGFLLEGFLKRSIEIKSNAFDLVVRIFFGDLFSQKGWKAISVNDFFDSAVDGKHVSETSLHGQMLKHCWAGNISDWDKQVVACLKDVAPENEISDRPAPGKANRYSIGTTVRVTSREHDFLCVAIGRTNAITTQTSTDLRDLSKALTGLLAKARTECSGHTLNIPLIGNGLSRTGIKPQILVCQILLAIFTESKKEKITNEIQIVLPKDLRTVIDLSNIKDSWR
jgi:hypothetical protein